MMVPDSAEVSRETLIVALYVARSIGKYCQAEQLKQIGDPLFAIHVDESTSY